MKDRKKAIEMSEMDQKIWHTNCINSEFLVQFEKTRAFNVWKILESVFVNVFS